MFEMAKLLPPPSSNNEEYHEATWDTRDMNFKRDIIHKKIKDVLLTAMQEEVE